MTKHEIIYRPETQEIIDKINNAINGLKAEYQDKLKGYSQYNKSTEAIEKVLYNEFLERVRPYHAMLNDILSIAIPKRIVVVKEDRKHE
jgi:hypothetical protein